MGMELVQIGMYNSSTEANLVKAKLAASGVDAMIQADSASGAVPQLEAYSGVKVLVRDSDMEFALEILERMLPSGSDSG
jgi:hypothetical protein